MGGLNVNGRGLTVEGEATQSGQVSAFSPDDVADLTVWLKADSLSLNDGDGVSTWADQSGNGHDFTQGTGSYQPTFRTNVLNGEPVVRFDGSDDHLDNDTSITTPSSGVITVFCVYDNKSSSGDPMTFDTESSGPRPLLYHPTDSAVEWHQEDINLVNSKSRPFGHYIMEGYSDGDNSNTEFLEDGVLVDSTSSTGIREMPGNNPHRLAHDPNNSVGGGRHLNGDIAEYIIYGRNLTNTERSDVRSYLADKYGISLP